MELDKREQIKKVAFDIIAKKLPVAEDQDADMMNPSSPERETEINEKLMKVMNLLEGEEQKSGEIDVIDIERKIEETGILDSGSSEEFKIPENSNDEN